MSRVHHLVVVETTSLLVDWNARRQPIICVVADLAPNHPSVYPKAGRVVTPLLDHQKGDVTCQV